MRFEIDSLFAAAAVPEFRYLWMIMVIREKNRGWTIIRSKHVFFEDGAYIRVESLIDRCFLTQFFRLEINLALCSARACALIECAVMKLRVSRTSKERKIVFSLSPSLPCHCHHCKMNKISASYITWAKFNFAEDTLTPPVSFSMAFLSQKHAKCIARPRMVPR